MLQHQALYLAQQGHPTAIATLLGNQLRARGIQVRASRVQGCLQLVLETAEILDRPSITQRIQSGLIQIAPKAIECVSIVARHPNSTDNLWQDEFKLPRGRSSASVMPQPAIADKGDREIVLSKKTSAALAFPPSLRLRAQQKDTEAIAQLLSLHLNARIVRVLFLEECLWIALENDPVPDANLTAFAVATSLDRLQIDSLQTVIISARLPDRIQVNWTKIIDLNDPQAIAIGLSMAELVEFYNHSVTPKLRKTTRYNRS